MKSTPESSQTMDATYLARPTELVVKKFAIPEPRRNEVLVRIERAAVCGSDLHAVFDNVGFLIPDGQNPLPGRPGHESVGTVVRSKSPQFVAGDRVLVLAPGAFAEYIACPARLLVHLPEGQAFERMLMAQQLGGVLYAMQIFCAGIRFRRGATATIVGAGPVGGHFLRACRLRGFEQVIVSDVVPDRLEAARAGGADAVVDATQHSIVEVTKDLTRGEGADLVIEAAGYDATRIDAVRCVRRSGKVGLYGYPETHAPSPFPFADAFWNAPLSIDVVKAAQSVRAQTPFKQAVDLIAHGVIDIDHLLGTEYPLVAVGEAFAVARARKALKVQLIP